MKKVLITGGVGYHLSVKLLNEGYYIDILDNFYSCS